MFRDKNIEEAVIACLIQNKDCLEKIKQLSLDDFTFRETIDVFSTIQKLYAEGEPVDIITINNLLNNKYNNKLEDRAIIYLKQIMEKVSTTEYWSFYIKKLKEETYKRNFTKIEKQIKNDQISPEAMQLMTKLILNYMETEKNLDEHKYLISLGDVVTEDYSKREKVLSGLKTIDKEIGGFYMGEVTIWTGKTGQGKSTFVNQMICNAFMQGYSSCIYSGELVNSQLQNWINLQLAGESNIIPVIDEKTGMKSYGIPNDLSQKLKEMYKDKIYIYNNEFELNSVNHMSIVEIFKIAYEKYGCRVFVVDNLMSARFMYKSQDDYYTQQSCFVGELVSFAKSNNVHVHIVAHPKKTLNENLENEDISGTMDIANRADNVFVIARTNKEENPKEERDGTFIIRKSRSTGVANVAIPLYYNEKSHLFSTNKSFKQLYNFKETDIVPW